MKFCSDCGTGHDCLVQSADSETKARVEIARIEANRDIEVARVTAGAGVKIAEAEAENSGEHAEGVAEGLELALGAGDGDQAPEEGAPIVIEVPAAEGDGAADDIAEEPPEVVDVPETPGKVGYWDPYR